MKRVMVFCMIVALALGASGATCMQNLEKMVANPPPAVMVVINAAAPIIAIIINGLVEGSEDWATAASVQATIGALQAGLSVSLSRLNKLIAFLESNVFKTAQVKKMVKAGPMKAKAFNIQPLLDWQSTFK